MRASAQNNLTTIRAAVGPSESGTMGRRLRGLSAYSSKSVSALIKSNSLIQMLRYSTSWPSH